MNMSTIQINFGVLLDSDPNPLGVAAVGMLVVFLGLSLVSLCISFLPKVLAASENKTVVPPAGQVGVAVAPVSNLKEKECLLAIATAVYLQQTDADQGQKITWQRHGEKESAWLVSGRMQNFTSHGATGLGRGV